MLRHYVVTSAMTTPVEKWSQSTVLSYYPLVRNMSSLLADILLVNKKTKRYKQNSSYSIINENSIIMHLVSCAA